jgi:hypothetical protein
MVRVRSHKRPDKRSTPKKIKRRIRNRKETIRHNAKYVGGKRLNRLNKLERSSTYRARY